VIVMVSNQNNIHFGWMAGRYPGAIGHLYSPGGERGPYPFLPYALDNGAWGFHRRNQDFYAGGWLRLLDWAAGQEIKPLWAAVPDVVMVREATVALWGKYVGEVRARGIRPAFVLQDGMTFDDVPSDDCMLFVGGSTDWKMAAIEPWCRRFPGRVHVGRVNEIARLMLCRRAGAASVDGTGWWHVRQRKQLEGFLAMEAA
jgi:hypothetical protein